MSLASLAVPTTRPLSPPPTFPTFGSASSSDDDHERTGSRGSTLLTASSSFHSALSRASAASTDSDAADDDGELAELASRPSFGRDSRQGEHRRESETSEDTLAGDYSQHSSSITKAGSSRRTSTSFDKPTTVRKPAAPAMAPALLVTELSTASAPAQIQSIGKGSPDVDQGMRFGNASKRYVYRRLTTSRKSHAQQPKLTLPSPWPLAENHPCSSVLSRIFNHPHLRHRRRRHPVQTISRLSGHRLTAPPRRRRRPPCRLLSVRHPLPRHS